MTNTGSAALLADAALPLVWFTIPAVVLMLVPTVLLEGLLLKAWLHLSIRRALKASFLGNLASTLAGVPLATGLSYLANLALSPWTRQLMQKEHWQSPIGDVLMATANSLYISAYVAEARWLLPAALLIVLIPAFLISWVLEYWIAKAIIIGASSVTLSETDYPSVPACELNKAVRRANYVSYSLLFVLIAFLLIHSQFQGLF